MSVWRTVTRTVCGCNEIDCRWCTGPWVPPEKRSKRELVEDLAEAEEMNEKLRADLEKLHAQRKIVDRALKALGAVLNGDATLTISHQQPQGWTDIKGGMNEGAGQSD